MEPSNTADPSKSKMLLIVGGVVVVAIVVYALTRTPPAAPETPIQQAEDISSAVEDISSVSEVEVPSANPADAAASGVNPLEKTNPFKNAYENPFQ
ncbi:MAG: hypothetical protein G01um101472_500 [Parcubacteria group bacterium Gr01-1014_72]|jgi:hypothetical protein|nr:MAG: hypothetical protein G01um101472_500 [Parcubacteria group bacterium Gr01-1014_72]